MERLKGNDLMPKGGRARLRFPQSDTSASLKEFLSTFNTDVGYAQPNKYIVQIFPPVKLAPISFNDSRSISLRCESVTLPGRNLSSTPDSNVHGPLREVVNNVNYADSVAMVFQASADLRERVFFENWQYTAFNPKTWNVRYYHDYTGTVELYLLDKNDKTRYGLKLHECFPKEIGPTDLSYASTNEMIKLPITMNFRYWETLDTAQTENTTQTTQPEEGAHSNQINENRPATIVRLMDTFEGMRRV